MNEHTLQLRMSLPCMVVYVMDHCISRMRLHADYKSVQKISNFEAVWNCNWVESRDSSKDNRYEVEPCRTSAYRSFQLTVRL